MDIFQLIVQGASRPSVVAGLALAATAFHLGLAARRRGMDPVKSGLAASSGGFMMGKYLFLDTNIYLHFKPVDQLELERFGDGCTLVVPRVILGELNHHKDTHSLKTIRDRARRICREIREWSDRGYVHDGLAFEFNIKTSSPKEHDLDPESADDRFLADILEYQAPLADKILLSNDSNLCLTAKHVGIAVEEIDDRFSLPAALDPAEKEARRLRHELDQLRNACPRLEVGLVIDDSRLDVNANPVFRLRPNRSASTDEEIERKVEEVRDVLAGKYAPLPDGSFAVSSVRGAISPEEIARFERELNAYPDRHRKYLLESREFLRRPRFRFTVGITNVGTAPAQNIDIYLHFPDGFELYERECMPSGPQKPPMPQKPMTRFEQARAGLDAQMDNMKTMGPQFDPPTSFSLKRTNSYKVSDSFRVIKHNERACVEELVLEFASTEAAKAFRCDYRVTVDNLPDQICGGINFRFLPEGGDEA